MCTIPVAQPARHHDRAGKLQSPAVQSRVPEQGYDVEAVFPDDTSGGGDFMKRPGMRAMLAYLDAQPEKRYVVIFDDLKRFARDTEFHFKLKSEFAARGARIECLNYNFDDTPEGKFVETIFAAQGELEREQNRRQTLQKMRARVEKGYWVFQAPRGYRYARSREHGKLLVPDEPVASIVREAMEGYASGRFDSQVEVKRFLEAQPEYPKELPNGEIRNQRVFELMTRPVYAGYVEAATWGISLRKGHHEGLISFATYQRIQERLTEGAKAPARKDLNADFPLRGFVLCDDCDKPLTACWSRSKTGTRHPYYLCSTKGCESYRKSIRRDDMEGEFEAILHRLQPRGRFIELARAMFDAAWDMRLAQAKSHAESLKRDQADVQKQIDQLLDRIVEASNGSVIAAYEARINKLEIRKLALAEKAAVAGKSRHTREELFEPALTFLSKPWKLWETGRLDLRRIVLRLAFSSRISHRRGEGFRTPNLALPFKHLEEICMGKCKMAHRGGFEPPTPRFVVWCSIQLSYRCRALRAPPRRVAVCSERAGGMQEGNFTQGVATLRRPARPAGSPHVLTQGHARPDALRARTSPRRLPAPPPAPRSPPRPRPAPQAPAGAPCPRPAPPARWPGRKPCPRPSANATAGSRVRSRPAPSSRAAGTRPCPGPRPSPPRRSPWRPPAAAGGRRSGSRRGTARPRGASPVPGGVRRIRGGRRSPARRARPRRRASPAWSPRPPG